MSEDGINPVQQLFLAALELPAEERDHWLAQQCADDPPLLSELRSLLEHDRQENDPLENGFNEGLLLDAGFLKNEHERIQVRCPHCQHPVDLHQDQDLNEVICGSCGSGFRAATMDGTKSNQADSSMETVGGEPGEDSKKVIVYKSRSSETDQSASRYRRTELHARGGLGAVFLARDMELKRTVALKEILPDHATNPHYQQRFIFEAEVTGSLEHPGIVPVYGLGRYSDGRPYYAMRFIRGRSFRIVIQEFHKENPSFASGKYFGRPFRMLLARLIETCNAIHYAHEHGVLHRDIKPDNIMLGDYGETLVVDWGLAKLVDLDRVGGPRADTARIEVSGSGRLTTQGSEAGTPAYMSPEQAFGKHDQLDARTDVYSLGAVLFNVVTGQYSVEGTGRREIVANVREGKIRSVALLAPGAPRALASICQKAMQYDPADRYGTAVELAADIDRWMGDEAVLAHEKRETNFERAGRLLRRYRAWTVSAAAALLAMTAIAVIAILLISNARHKEHLARIEAQESKQEAVARYRDARMAIDTWLVQSSDALKFFPETQSVRRRLLQLATEDYQRLANRQSDDVELKLEQGRVLVKLGDLWQFQQEFDSARSNYKSALDLFESEIDDEDLGLFFAAERGNVHTRIGLSLADQERISEARREFETAIRQLTTIVDKTRDSLARRYLASTHINHAAVLERHGEFERAIESLSQGRKQYEMLDAGANTDTHLALARARELSGRISSKTGRHQQAMIDFNEAAEGLLPLVADQPDHPEYLDALASVYISKASDFRDRGLEDQAFDALRSSLKYYRQLHQAVPDDPRYAEYLGRSLTDLGLVRHEAGFNQEAEIYLEQAYELLFELVDEHPNISRCRENLATCHDAMGQVWLDRSPDPRKATEALFAAIRSYESLISEDLGRLEYFERFATAESHYARSLYRENNNEDARKYFAQAISTLQPMVEEFENSDEFDSGSMSYSNALANVHYFFGLMLYDQQDSEAREHFESARETWIRIGDKQTARDKHHLAWLLATCPIEPVRDLNSSLKYAEDATSLAPENARFVTTHALASLLVGDADQAFALLDRVKMLRGHWIDRDFFVLAMAQRFSNQPDQARKSMVRGVSWMEEHQPFNTDIQLLRETADSFVATEVD